MSKGKEKKKKSLLRRILKYTGIVLLLLIVAIVLIPIFFKDQIKEMALKEVNTMLKADVAVGDFDLTIFSSFPKMKLRFDDVSVTGRDEFEGIKLIEAKSIEAKLDFWSVITMDDITVRSVKLIEPNIQVKVLESGLANYDIVKSDEELKEEEVDTTSSPFKFSLDYYEIKDGNIIYDDRKSPMYAKIKNLNHSGSGDMTADVIDFKTKTTIDELSYEMDGLTYLSKVKTALDMNLLMEFKDKSSKFTLKDNKLSLNALALSFDGFYEMLEDHDAIDFKLVAGNTSFKDLLSLIPVFYQSGYESMVTKGSLSLNAFVKGNLDDKNLPAWDFNMKVNNASIAYPDMPATIDNVNIIAGSKFPGGSNLDNMTVDVDQLKATFAGNTLDADFHLKHPMTDPYMEAKLNAKIDLATLDQVYPMEDKYTGKLTSDISFKGKMSTIEKEDYENIDAKGSLLLQDFQYSSTDLAVPVDIKNLLFEFSPQQLKMADLQATMGKSDFTMSGEVKNYMGYLFKEDEALQGVFNYHSNILNIDEIMPPSEASASGSSEQASADKTESAAPENSGSDEPVLVPKNIDFVLNTTIDKLIYDGMDIEKLKGRVIIKNEEVNLENLAMQTMGGSVVLTGKYNTQDHQTPKMTFSYDLTDINIQKLSKNFLTIEKLAPIAKYVEGDISSKFSMTSNLTPSFEPIYSTLSGKGSLSSEEVIISGFKALERLGDALNMNSLKVQKIKNILANFEIKDGKVKVEPFNIKMGKINTEVQGTTSLEQEIDYELKMMIPKDQIPGQLLVLAEKAIAQAKKIPGFKMKELPDEIPITALITNTITDPKVKTNIKEKLTELGGDIKGGIRDFVDDTKEKIKDTIKKVVDDGIDKAKEELEKQKQKIIDEGQKQADNVKAEAKKLANKTREEADKNGQKLIEAAGANPLKKKAAELSAKKLSDEGETSAKKIENEANTQANKIMDTARKKADDLKL